MKEGHIIAVIIPALDEQQSIGLVLDAVPDWVDRVVVADNGSTDRTAEFAQQHGAEVVFEPRRGYGSACLAALARLAASGSAPRPEAVVFLDGDFSDNPAEMALLVDPILHDGYDLVLGSRVLGRRERGSLTLVQRFGSFLSGQLTYFFFGVRYTDLGPFRAVRWSSLQRMKMDDRDYGWTIQMQVRAARLRMRVIEVPVSYRKRAAGRSKVTGTLKGMVGAGTTIVFIIFQEAARAALGGELFTAAAG